MSLPPTSMYCVLEFAGAALFSLAALQDVAFRLVPNAVPVFIASIGIVLRVIDGNLPISFAAAAIVFLVATVCWRMGLLGGADVKLFGAGALLVVPHMVGEFVLSVSLAGGVLALIYAAASRLTPQSRSGKRPHGLLRRLARVERRRLQRGGPLPYATALTAGACFTLLAA